MRNRGYWCIVGRLAVFVGFASLVSFSIAFIININNNILQRLCWEKKASIWSQVFRFFIIQCYLIPLGRLYHVLSFVTGLLSSIYQAQL